MKINYIVEDSDLCKAIFYRSKDKFGDGEVKYFANDEDGMNQINDYVSGIKGAKFIVIGFKNQDFEDMKDADGKSVVGHKGYLEIK